MEALWFARLKARGSGRRGRTADERQLGAGKYQQLAINLPALI